MLRAGSSLYVLCIFLTSLMEPGRFYQATQAVGMGIFSALIFFLSFTIISYHFERRRMLAMSIVPSGAAVIFPIMLNQIGQGHQLVTTTRAMGSLIGGLLLFSNLAMKTRL
ncbi:hypothetical protein GGX14DRAFT_324836, partial [Mycena pura]